MSRALISLLLLLAPGVAEAGEWKQFLDEDGVRGYARSVEGSNILMLRTTIVVPARIEVVGAILRDIEGLKRPGTSCTEVRFLEKRDHNHYTFYAAYDFPWPLADRDVVVEVETRYLIDEGRVISDLRAVEHPGAPAREDHVRITDLSSQFVLEYLGREKTGVVVTSRVDPGGAIPDFLVNMSSKSNLRSNALDLRNAVSKPEYLRAAAESTDTALVESLLKDPQTMRRIFNHRLGELIADHALVERLLADERVYAALLDGSGEVGAVLMQGWGSRQSKARALRALLRLLLSTPVRDRAAVERFVSDPELVDRILAGHQVDPAVAAFIDRQAQGGR